MSQLWTNKGLTLFPFIPVPQDTENRDDQEDGEESRKPRKDAAALVFISKRKTECQDPAVGGWGGWRKCFFQEFEPIWNGSRVKDGRGGIGIVVEDSHLFVGRGKLYAGEGLPCVNAYWMPGFCM